MVNPEPAAAPPTNPYPFTAAVLTRRARRYRDLVVLVVLIGFAAPGAALLLWSWQPLLGWLLVVPACGAFVTLDARAVARWRAALLDGWVAGTLDLDAVRDGLTGIKLLPPATLAGMLDPLPTRARLGCFPDPKPPVREALAATVSAIDAALVRRTALAGCAATVTLSLLAAAAVAGSWWPLAGLPVSLALSRAARRIGSAPTRRWLRRVAGSGVGQPAGAAFAALAGKLDWIGLPPGASGRWLGFVGAR